jgi:hypothetical protein
MSQVQVTIDGATAVLAAAELRERARWYRGRASLLRVLRGSDAPTEAEVIDDLWGRQLDSAAAAMERELYQDDRGNHFAGLPPQRDVIEPGDPRHPWAPEVRYPVPANPIYEGMD